MQKKETLLTILASIIMMVAVIGITYAFYNASLTKDVTPKAALTDQITFTYTDCGSNNSEHCQLINASLKPGESVEKTFRIQNTGGKATPAPIYFIRLLNTFTSNDLVYTLQDVTDANNPITLVASNTPVPYHITEVNNVLITSNNTIPANTTKEYKLTVTFINRATDQAYNADAEFLIQIGIDKYVPTYTVSGVNSGSGTVTASSNVIKNGTTTLTVTPSSGYALFGGSCTNGYTISNMNTGAAYTSSQNVTINNNNVANNSVCTFTFQTAVITFHLGGSAYQALRGMNWYQWVNSTYNTAGWYIGSTSDLGDIAYSEYMVRDNHCTSVSCVSSTSCPDIIEADHSYSKVCKGGAAIK